MILSAIFIMSRKTGHQADIANRFAVCMGIIMKNIIVCIKQVPDTTEVRLNPETGTLIREGVPSIINPDDKAGLEVALQLKEKTKAKVTVLTMGPAQADIALREAMAMGADEAILLSGREFAGSDTWATSSAIAAAIKNLPFDLIITGRQAIDGDTAQVGPQIAEHLKIPQISYVASVEVKEDKLLVKRNFEDRYYMLETSLPLLITVLGEEFTPRYMSVGGIFDAYREREIITWGYEDVKDNVDMGNLGLKGSPTRVKKSFTKSVKPAGTVYKDVSSDEAVQIIMEKLREKHIIS